MVCHLFLVIFTATKQSPPMANSTLSGYSLPLAIMAVHAPRVITER